jgi:asparagine synthetase B (glutamine-hydrolysing)
MIEILCFNGSFIENGIFYTGLKASERFRFLLEKFGPEMTVDRLDGFFRFVAGDEQNIWLGADHAGSYPLFYRTDPDFAWAVHAGDFNNGFGTG